MKRCYIWQAKFSAQKRSQNKTLGRWLKLEAEWLNTWIFPYNFRFDSKLIILLKLEHWETFDTINTTCKIPDLPWEIAFSGFTVSCSENNKKKIFLNVCVSQSVMTNSCTLCNPMDCSPPTIPPVPCPWNFPGKNTGVGCHSLLQRIFLT